MRRRTFLQATLSASALAAGGLSCATAPRARAPAARPLRLLVLGGTGYLGPAIVEAARPRGHALTLFNRGKTNPGLFPDLEQLHGDRDGKLDALRGRTWDAVIDDTGYVPRVVRQSAELLAPAVGRYLFVSTLSVYADEKTLGQDETAARATLPPEAAGSEEVRKYYSPLKAACEDVIGEVYGERRTVVRPGYIIGPRDPYDRLTYWAARCARGGPMLAPGDGSDPTQFIDVRDLGVFVVGLVEQGAGGAYNATGPARRLTMRGMLEACREAAGAPGELVWVPEALIRRHGVSPEDDAREDLPLWLPHMALGEVSVARAIGRGLAFRPVVETARDTLAWWRAQPEARRAKLRAGLAPEKEAAILEDLRTGG
jgi:2'-hydroxyisoflavone reductase